MRVTSQTNLVFLCHWHYTLQEVVDTLPELILRHLACDSRGIVVSDFVET